MNENIDLTKILKDCPEGWEFWSDNYGKVRFKCISKDNRQPIFVKRADGITEYYTKEGWCNNEFPASCLLWPSKDCRDWSKFTAPWLKKKPKHKFLVGQYITDGYVGGQITSIEDHFFCYKIVDFMRGINRTIPFALQDNYHLWTIQDAKEGDVLSFYSEYKGNKMVQVGIIEKYVGKHGGCSNTFKIHVGVNWDNNLQIGEYMGCSDIHPATKEQHDALMKAINDAGYKWKAETKTLEKLIQPKFKVGDKIVNVPMKYWGASVTQGTISKITEDKYIFSDGSCMSISNQDSWDLVFDKKPKFDPKILKPFDKVLVRDKSCYNWMCELFSYIKTESEFKYWCISNGYKYCIPYNDDTKHLLGTNREATEYYRYWED